MAEVNIYYHKQTNSWWTDGKLNGIDLTNYIKENPIGLGTIELDTNNKTDIEDLNEICSMFIPEYLKGLNKISTEIEKNDLKNAQKVSKRKLKNILKSQ
jgi:hypothetical protein